jgi:hypothetical protein
MRFSTICLLVLTSSVSAERGVGRLRKQQHLQFHDEEHAHRLRRQTGSNLRNLQGGGRGSGATKDSNVENKVVGEVGDADEDGGVQLITAGDLPLYTGIAKNYDYDPTPAPYDAPSPFDDPTDMYMSLDNVNPPTFRPAPAPIKVPNAIPSASPSTHPSPAPSASPSVAPSTSPSTAPSVSPSSAPTETPSAIPSSGPSASPSTKPESPSQAPSDAPSGGPSASPSVTGSLSPTETDSEVPSISQSAAPSESLSESPSSSPSEQAPSASPSLGPSTTPNTSPIGAPITPAPITPMPGVPSFSETCVIRMTTPGRCQRENGRPCALIDAIPVDTLLCSGGSTTGNPSEMGWIYRPNLCESSTTVQNMFVCTDSNDGPPAAAGNGRVFIEVTGAGGDDTVYFSGTVLPGEVVIMKNPDSGLLNGNVQVKILEGTDRNGIDLQTMAISIRCSGFEDNTIGKKYGSLEFVSYIDGSGTAATGFEKLTYFNRVINQGDTDFTFEAFGSGNSDESGLTRTDITPVDNIVLVGAEIFVRHDYNILLVDNNGVTISGFIVGTTAAGGTCDDVGSTDFLIVRPAPPPTQSPVSPAPTPSPTTLAQTSSPVTPAPTTLPPMPTSAPITPIPTSAPITPVPTPIPPLGSCFLSTEVRCANGAIPCEDIPALSEDELRCNVGGAPQQLGWFYHGVGCDATTTTQTIGCLDSEGGPPSATGNGRVFIEAQGVNSNRIYHFRSVLPGDYLVWVDSDDMPIEESIVVDIYEGSNQAGRKLQTMVFNVGCGNIDQDVRLGKSFGALEFASYSGSNGAVVQSFIDVLYTFTVQNTGREDFELIEFTSNIETETEDLVPAPPRNMISAEGGSFSGLAVFTVPVTGPDTIDAFVVARGLVQENNFTCTSTSDTYSFNVV